MITLTAPPSKSLSHRALIAAALTDGRSLLTGLLDSDDLRRTGEALEATGIEMRPSQGALEVTGQAGGPRGGSPDAPVALNMHESGTSCRLLTAVVAAGEGSFRIHGAPRLHERPLGSLIDALRTQGVRCCYEGQDGYPPVTVTTQGLAGGNVDISLAESSQYLSGLLLAGPRARTPLIINIEGSHVVSWPYVTLTAQVMADFAVPVRFEQRTSGGWREVGLTSPGPSRGGASRVVVDGGSYQPRSYNVEGDWSNASYFLAAGAIGPESITLHNLRRDSLQGDRRIVDILQAMGAQPAWKDGLTIKPAELMGVEVDMGACPDLVPTVAVLACFAAGETTIRNVAHLRIKECDRLAAPATELAKVGCVCDVLDDGLRIHPNPRLTDHAGSQAVPFSTYGDHRMAMSLSLFELAGIKVQLDDPTCVGKSFPRFWDNWRLIAPPAPQAPDSGGRLLG